MLDRGLNAPASAPAIPERKIPGQNMIIGIAVVAALYFGREIFVPIALAVLLTFALAPAVSRLRKVGLPRPVSVVVTVLAAFASIFLFAFVVGSQLAQLATNLPAYQRNIETKIQSIKDAQTGGGIFDRLSNFVRDVGEEIGETEESPQPAASPASEPEREPIPVVLAERTPTPLQVLQSVVGPLLEPVATAGIVIVFVIFMLLRREDLRDRFIRLVGNSDIHRTTTAMDDAGKRVGQYLLAQLVVNVTYAIPVSLGLWLIGVPNALLWGLLALVLRFIPYIGPVVAAVFPLGLAVAVDSGWTMVVWTAAMFIVIELISNNIIEPILYGSRTGLSAVAIIVSAIFWTWLWGPVGLLLSTPLTVCMVVLGRHVSQFEFLDVLLGNEPVLSPSEQLYQRLLAGDPDEATEHAEEYLKEAQIVDFYDDVALPALVLGEQDRARGALEDERRKRVSAGALTLVENLSELDEVADATAEKGGPAVPAESTPAEEPAASMLCAGGRGDLDDAAAAMLVQVIERAGYSVRLATYEALDPSRLFQLRIAETPLVLVAYLNRESIAHARYLVRRLRRYNRTARIGVAFWSFEGDEEAHEKTRAAIKADFFISSIRQAASVLAETPDEITGSAAAPMTLAAE